MRPQQLGLVAMAFIATGISAASLSSGHKMYSVRHRNEFMKAMESHYADADSTYAAHKRQSGYQTDDKSSGVRKLRRRMLEKAKYIPPDEIPLLRDLEENYNGQNADDYYYGYNPDNEADYYKNDDGYYEAGDDDDITSSSSKRTYSSDLFPFDLTQYSISYHRCANVRQFDDQLSAQSYTTSVFATKHFAMFRLCPTQSCDPDVDDEAAEKNYWAARAYQSSQTSSGSSSNGTSASNQQQRSKNLFEKIRYGGANGDRCNSDYGEYMLELEDYLGIMTDYHNERFEKYCSACKQCMYDTYNHWMHSNGWDRRDLKDINDPSWMDELNSEEFQRLYNNRDLGGYSPYTTCPEYGTCTAYANVCEVGIDNSLTQYFQCTAHQVYSGKTVYIGPRCSYDGISIKLGVYSDEHCNNYVGNSVDINDLLGVDGIDNDSLFAPYITGNVNIQIESNGGYTSEIKEYYKPIDQICIPCKASRVPYEVLGGDFDFNDDNNNDVNDLCEELYVASAQCDKYISYRNYKQYTSRKQRAQQELSCDYIQSIVSGNFDQLGFVQTNFGVPEIIQETWDDITPAEAYGLVVVLSICFLLAMWIHALHYYIKQREPWRIRRRYCRRREPDSRRRSVSKVMHDDDDSMGSFESDVIYGHPSKITKRMRSAAYEVSRTASKVLPRTPSILSQAASSVASKAKAVLPFKRTKTWAAGSDHSCAQTDASPDSVQVLKNEIDKLRVQLNNATTSFEAHQNSFEVNDGFEIKNVTTHQEQSVAEISEIKGSWSEALPMRPHPVDDSKPKGEDLAASGFAAKTNAAAAPHQTCLADEMTEIDDQSKLEDPKHALRYALPTQESAVEKQDGDWDDRSSFDNNSSASYSSYASSATGSSRYEWDSAANTLVRIGSSVTGMSSIDENGLLATDVDDLQKQLRDLKRHLASSSPKASAIRKGKYSSERSQDKPKSRSKVRGRIKKIFGRK